MRISSRWSPSALRYARAATVVVVLLALWTQLAASGVLSRLILPTPADVIRAFWRLTADGVLTTAAAATLARVVLAVMAALAIGVPAGLALGLWKRLYEYLDTPLHALRSVPATALFPLLLVVVGIGEGAIIALAAYPSTLIVMINAVTGVRFANPRRLQHARALGLSGAAVVTDVLVYEALPGIVHGLRVAVSYSLALVVAVEMFLGVTKYGLGRVIYDHQLTYDIPETYAAILATAACGVGLNALVTALERRMLAWVPQPLAGAE